MIGHHSRLRDMMGQSYPIYACSHANNIEGKITECWLVNEESILLSTLLTSNRNGSS